MIMRAGLWRECLRRLMPAGLPAVRLAVRRWPALPACDRDLPRLPAEVCPVCAEEVPGGAICGSCLATPPHFDATFAAFRYGFPADRLVHALKYQRRVATADFFATALLAGPRPDAHLIVPLPLHPARLAERGFNQSVEIARPLARTLKLPIELDGCLRSRDAAPQASLPWKERRKKSAMPSSAPSTSPASR
jgi:predicted amidophosphoribosyltransferase